jgi:HAE1 family hydrophobic/amphiphilic exporter-1
VGGFSRFFIYRPVFALVISLVVVIVGGLSVPLLPIESTPDITPPTVKVSTTYPGANPQVVEETIAQPIEAEVNGVEDMLYMSSKSTSAGSLDLTVTFEVGTDIDMATVLTQNRVALAEPKLPEEVKRQGVKVEKQSTQILLMVGLISPDGRYDDFFLSNYATTQVKDVLSRVEGVGKVEIFGAKDFGMRVWLDPRKVEARGLTVAEVTAALREQNVQVAAGKIGEPPMEAGQNFQYSVTTLGRLSTPEQFEEIVLKRGEDGRLVRLRDVARIELGSQSYAWDASLDGKPASLLGIYQLPGANALGAKEGVVAAMEDLATSFPQGMEYTLPYDSTEYINASIAEVVETLIVAILLVVFTVFVFLQDFRTTLVPAVTIPVSLIGTFAVMLALGQSINNLTLFGLVLAIGIVVDDAIVVVENTMRLIDEEGLGAREAVSKAMGEVGGAIVATTLVLLAVFAPTLVMPGLTGRMYRPFAITISVATIFSSINALTLSPALCGLLLRPSPKKRNIAFRAFNRVFEWGTNGYSAVVGGLVRRLALVLILFAGLLGAMGFGLVRLPGGFVPPEDQGYVFLNAQLPNNSSLERTSAVMDRVTATALEIPGVRNVVVVKGYSMLEAIQGPNYGMAIITLDNWSERPGPEQAAWGILRQLQPRLAQIREAVAFGFLPPTIQGLGAAGGFQLELQDRGGTGLNVLEQIANDVVARGNASPVITRLNQSFRASVPQLYIDVDRTKAKTLDVPLDVIFGTLQANLGSAYVNDFNLFGRTWRVMVQADQEFRRRPEDIALLKVRSRSGAMVPLGTLADVSFAVGPETISRFNMFRSASITGTANPGFSEGQAADEIERIVQQASPAQLGYAWSGITLQQKAAGNLAPIIFALALVFVFLFLAAQYESWATPLSVMLTVPVALAGAVAGAWIVGMDNNIYFQVGLVLLIGLASKNAILVVEFAKQLREEGKSVIEAALAASRLRFRAILMTAFSFILGVIPLVIASGAGANSRRAVGIAVFGGMLLATCVGIFFIPLLDVAVQSTVERFSRKRGAAPAPSAKPAPSAE